MNIRKAQLEDCDAIARVCVDTWRTAYQGLINDDYLQQMSYLQFSKSYQDLLSGAMDGKVLLVAVNITDQVVGFILGGPERKGYPDYSGEIYALYVKEDCQGQGIGTALFGSAVDCLKLQGHRSIMLWMLSGNRYHGFYQKHGGTRLGLQVFPDFPESGDSIELIAYGWPSLPDSI